MYDDELVYFGIVGNIVRVIEREVIAGLDDLSRFKVGLYDPDYVVCFACLRVLLYKCLIEVIYL